MKKTILTSFLLLFFLNGFCQIHFTINNFNGKPILARYLMGKVYPVDTLSGVTHYQVNNKQLDRGVYVLILDKKYFEFPVGKAQQFTITADYSKDDIQKTVQVTGGNDNSIFQKFLITTNPEEKDRFLKQNLSNVHDDFIRAFMTSLTPVIPPANANDTVKFFHFRKHYWDNVNFSLPEMLNSPLLTGKLNYYFNKMIPQQPDTVIHFMARFLSRSMSDTIRHSVLDFLIHYTFESKVMGMEKSFVWLAGNYFIDGKCQWLPEKSLKTIREQYYYNKYCLVGNKGYNLKLIDNKGLPFELYQVNSDYTILLFYDISCRTCQGVVKDLEKNYNELFTLGVEIVALNTEQEHDNWLSFIKNYHISEWDNVMDPDNTSNFHTLYGVQSTPTIYLLDRHKKIIGKKLTVKQIIELIKSQKS